MQSSGSSRGVPVVILNFDMKSRPTRWALWKRCVLSRWISIDSYYRLYTRVDSTNIYWLFPQKLWSPKRQYHSCISTTADRHRVKMFITIAGKFMVWKLVNYYKFGLASCNRLHSMIIKNEYLKIEAKFIRKNVNVLLSSSLTFLC